MLDQYLKKIKDDVLRAFVTLFPPWMTPNQISLLAFVFGVLSAYCTAIGLTTIGFYCWIVNRVLDGFDGLVARERNQCTDFGGYLDLVLDTAVYSLVPLGHAVYMNDPTIYQVCIYMVGTYFVNMTAMMFCTALIQQKKYDASREDQEKRSRKQLNSIYLFVGLIEGTETAVVYTLFFLFPSLLLQLFIFFSVSVTIMIVQRVFYARSILTL